MPASDLLLHPVRLRIVQSFLDGRTLTTKELAAELADVPTASLYRQVSRLERGGALIVVRERKVRGTMERTYALRSSALGVSVEEIAAMTVDDHRQLVMSFVAGLLADFERYFDGDDINLERDGVTLQTEALWLDDAEMTSVIGGISAVLAPHLTNAPRPGRQRRALSTVVVPAADPE